MSENYLCIHGHFYQPPRENPWLDEIECQPTAFPYHDWNERVTRECYGPNARARIEADPGRILKLVNNYAYMNFDFGPTLLSWLEKTHAWIYREIIAADQAAKGRYQGHGNAIAQVYNHVIMPLASTRDKQTQIRWGLKDFARRFGRPAEGMWLAETAVDLESLALMAEEGVRFTVLSPTQAEAVRDLGGSDEAWDDVSGGNIDTTAAYRVYPTGHESPFIDVFFFDRDLSRAVAYEKILASGSDFLARLEKGNGTEREGAHLVNIATDGESYGHHFKFGDMTLAWIFDHLEQQGGLKLTNYAWFLEQFPPEKEVRILEDTSWSCAHGIERWRSDCGCNVNHRKGWNQAWRKPLREAMDWLSGQLAALFEERGGRLFADPWAARDDYVLVLLDPSPENRERFLEKHGTGRLLDRGEQVEAFELMELQRMALYMYTSCGWFFDDIAGIEATQILMYADRAMNLAGKWSRTDLESTFLTILARARSNENFYGDGAAVFDSFVKKRRMSVGRITANYAFAQLFQKGPVFENVFKGRITPVKETHEDPFSGRATGEILVSDPMTGKQEKTRFSASGEDPAEFECQVRDGAGEVETYTLPAIIPDTRNMITKSAARAIMDRMTGAVKEQDLMFLLSLEPPSMEKGKPFPAALADVLGIFVRGCFMRLSEKADFNPRGINVMTELIRRASAWDCSLQLDDPETRERGRKLVNRLIQMVSHGAKVSVMRTLMELLDLAEAVSLKMDLWGCQNYYWDLSTNEQFMERLSPEQTTAFTMLGKRLGFLL